MPKKSGLLTKLETKNPIGALAKGMSDHRIVEELKSVNFLTDDLQLTRRGKEYALGKLSQMDNVERIMLERFILEHHGVEKEIIYEG